MTLDRCLRASLLAGLSLAAWLLAVPAEAASRVSERLSKDKVDFFEQKIRPVLTRKCYECHSGDAAKAKGHLVLDTRAGLRKGGDSGPAIVPGRPNESK